MLVKWLLSYIQFIDWFFKCLDLYAISFYLNFCSWYVCCYFSKKWSLSLIIKWSLSYIQLIDCFFTCFDMYVFFIRILVKRMLLAVLQELVTIYQYKIIIFYIQFIDWFFTYFDLYVVSYHLNYCSEYDICCFTRSSYIV